MSHILRASYKSYNKILYDKTDSPLAVFPMPNMQMKVSSFK